MLLRAAALPALLLCPVPILAAPLLDVLASQPTWSGTVVLDGHQVAGHSDPLLINPGTTLYGLSFVMGGCCYVPTAGTVTAEITGAAPITADFHAVQPIPEPTTVVLFGSGLLVWVRRGRKPTRDPRTCGNLFVGASQAAKLTFKMN